MTEDLTGSIGGDEADCHVVCPSCGGVGCSRCGETGYILRSSLAPAELAALRDVGVSRSPIFLLEEQEDCWDNSEIHYAPYDESDDTTSVSS